MTHNIIKTENYLLVVDDSEIKEGDWIYESDSNSVNIAGKGYHNFTQSDAKIIAHLPLNNSPVLEGVPLLPPLEDDEAINKAKEKYKYTEEDIMKAVVFGYRQNGRNGHIDHEEERDFIQSLQQPKMPVAFECEEIYCGYMEDEALMKPKTTTNPQGQTVLAGKYIY